MNWKRIAVTLAAVLATAGLIYAGTRKGAAAPTLTGLVTTDEVVLGPQIAGRLVRLTVREGDLVTKGQLLAELEPAELEADRSYFEQSAQVLSSEVDERTAALKQQELENGARIRQASAAVAAAESERAQAAAQLEDARITFGRQERLAQSGAVTDQERDHARRTFEAAQARVDSLDRQIDAQRAALELARAGAEQATVRRAALATTRRQQGAAEAQRAKADVRLAYTQLLSPIDGVVDVRAARLGEYVAVGQPVLTLVNPDDYWVRADVEESLVESLRLGEQLEVTLPSGTRREGTITWRGVDAAFATQHDVSRTRRDVRTFEVRLRVDNADRRLALGSTATVTLPEVTP